MPVAVHTGAADACKQAIRYGARSLEHAYLIDEEGIDMATRGGAYIVPTMQMTQEDLAELHAGTSPAKLCGSSAATTKQSSTPNGS
jgi:imidazolonepropionase-like amidohydrolase